MAAIEVIRRQQPPAPSDSCLSAFLAAYATTRTRRAVDVFLHGLAALTPRS